MITEAPLLAVLLLLAVTVCNNFDLGFALLASELSLHVSAPLGLGPEP